jgi:hypothetical protein
MKQDIECFNCKKCSHIKANCWAKGGAKEGQGPKRNIDKSTATAEETEHQEPEAWLMMHTEDDDEVYIDLDEDIGGTWV